VAGHGELEINDRRGENITALNILKALSDAGN
jgi:hypothetical protein